MLDLFISSISHSTVQNDGHQRAMDGKMKQENGIKQNNRYCNREWRMEKGEKDDYGYREYAKIAYMPNIRALN